MQKIADAAGVSVATVSLCLRNHPRFPAETCKRIQAIANEMGYRPNPLVSTLMVHLRTTRPTEYSATIGFINAFKNHTFAEISPNCKRLFQGMRERAEQMGYGLDEFRIREPGMTTGRLNKILFARGINALVIGPLSGGRGHLSLDWSKFAIAAVGYSMWRPSVHRVAHNQFRAMRLVMRNLDRLGYRRVGLVMSSNFDERVDHNWLAGLLVSQRHTSSALLIPPLIQKALTRESFFHWFNQHRPEVVVSPEYPPFELLQSSGLRVPGDVGYVHLDWVPELGPFAGIDQRSEIIGASAVDTVVGQLYHNERGVPKDSKLVLVEGVWQEGATLLKTPREQARDNLPQALAC